MTAVVVGGGIAGLAAARRLEQLLPDVAITLVEATARLGGIILTERHGGFVIEGGPDSFLTSKPRAIGLCEELGITDRVIPRDARNAATFVRHGNDLRPLPAGLTGMIPTRLDTLETSGILAPAGLARFVAEADLPPAPDQGDESIGAFISRRFGAEAYERLIEPLMGGIYAGDAMQLSLAATFPQLRRLELEHGSLTRGLVAPEPSGRPPFASLDAGMDVLVTTLATSLVRTRVVTGRAVTAIRRAARHPGYEIAFAGGETMAADAVVLATPPHVTASIVEPLDASLAAAHAAIPQGSPVIVTLAYDSASLDRQPNGYGYVIPRSEGSVVTASTWSSSKWPGRAPDGQVLVRVFIGRYGVEELAGAADADLIGRAQTEVAEMLGARGTPTLHRVQRWPRGMPQYVLGHPERLALIDARLAEHPGLALAGSAYRGVGLPDCIASGERAAEMIASATGGAEGAGHQ